MSHLKLISTKKTAEQLNYARDLFWNLETKNSTGQPVPMGCLIDREKKLNATEEIFNYLDEVFFREITLLERTPTKTGRCPCSCDRPEYESDALNYII